MSFAPQPLFPTLDSMGSSISLALGATESDYFSDLQDITMSGDSLVAISEPGPTMNHPVPPAQNTNPPAGPMPYFGSGHAGALVDIDDIQITSAPYNKIETISDLLRSHAEKLAISLSFEFNTDLGAILHTGKCAECVQFGQHILSPENQTDYNTTVSLRTDSILEPMRSETAVL